MIPGVILGTPDEIVRSLLNSESEFGLLFAKVPIPQIEYEALREEPMALVVQAETWRETKGSSRAVKMNKVLENIGYISSFGAQTQVRPSRVLRELFGKLPRIGFEANGQEAQKRICVSGGGIAYLQRFMVEDEIKSGVLHEISIDHPHSFKLWLALRRGHGLSLPATLFLEHLRSSNGRWRQTP